MIKYKLKIIDIINEAKGTKTYYFEKPENFTWESGSSIHMGIVGFDEGESPNKSLVRHMSIMTLSNENKIGITTRVPGSSSDFKNHLFKLNIGDEAVFFKLSSKMPLRRCNRPVILLSMGVGLASMRPIIHSFLSDKTNPPYLINVNVDSSNNFIYKEELDKFVDEHYKNYWLSSRKAFYELLDELTQTENNIYYIVGSFDFVKDTIQSLKAKNVSVEDIIIDKREDDLKKLFDL